MERIIRGTMPHLLHNNHPGGLPAGMIFCFGSRRLLSQSDLLDPHVDPLAIGNA